jgi:hypothetical protein
MSVVPFERRSFSGSCPTNTTITGGISAGDTTLTLSSATGWPTTTAGPFVATLDSGNGSEEQIQVGTRSGTACSAITRGINGTSASSHSAGASILHTDSKADLDEANLAVAKYLGLATAVGQIPVVDAANSVAMVQAKASGQILVGNGTTLASVAVSGDATLASTGALSIGNSKITNAMMADNAVDSAELVAGAVDLTHLGTDFTTAGKALLNDADASAQRTTLGLGTMATQAASAVTISGGAVTGITDLAVADGGTGASTAADARTNLGVAIGSDVTAFAATSPLGTVASGYAAVTTNQTPIGPSVADLTGLTITFTAVADRRYRITGYVPQIVKTSVESATVVYITDGSNAEIEKWGQVLAEGKVMSVNIQAVVVPGAGSVTYKLRAEAGSGTFDMTVGATRPAWVLVEDIGT